jgi:hypothetical protein
MTIRIVSTPKTKPSGKYCPFFVDSFDGPEPEKADKKQ